LKISVVSAGAEGRRVGSAFVSTHLPQPGAKKWCLNWVSAEQGSDILLKVVPKMSWRDSSDNGAKRGRTETLLPTLRPITPAGAKLDNWMKDIEDKINKLEATEEGIHKLCNSEFLRYRVFRGAHEHNITELEKKIGQITGRLDKIQDDSKENEQGQIQGGGEQGGNCPPLAISPPPPQTGLPFMLLV